MYPRRVSGSLKRAGYLLPFRLMIFKKPQILGSCLLTGTRNFRRRQSLDILNNTVSVSSLAVAPTLDLNTQGLVTGIPILYNRGYRINLPFSTTTSLPIFSVRLENKVVLFYKWQSRAPFLYGTVKRLGS